MERAPLTVRRFTVLRPTVSEFCGDLTGGWRGGGGTILLEARPINGAMPGSNLRADSGVVLLGQPGEAGAIATQLISPPCGDVTNDWNVDSAYLSVAINVLLGQDTDPNDRAAVDCNYDGKADAMDLQGVVDAMQF